MSNPFAWSPGPRSGPWPVKVVDGKEYYVIPVHPSIIADIRRTLAKRARRDGGPMVVSWLKPE